MAAITFTQTDLDNLKEALVTGAEEMVIGDKKIRFRSQKHLLELIKLAQESINGDATSTTSSSTIQGTFSKGKA